MAGIDVTDLKEQVIDPVLAHLDRVVPGMQSPSAEMLLLGTAAQESQMGRYLRQHPTGPARGIYQIEPATLQDLLNSLTQHHHDNVLSSMLEWSSPALPIVDQLAGNLYFSTAVARVNYWRKPFSMPPATPEAMAAIWKQWWNTENGGGTTVEWLANYRRYAVA